MPKNSKKVRRAKAAAQPKTMLVNLGELHPGYNGQYMADGVRWNGVVRENATKYGRTTAESIVANLKRLGFHQAFSEPA